MKSKLAYLLSSLLIPLFGFGQNLVDNSNKKINFEIESGFLTTKQIEFSGYQQGNATENWKSTTPTFRFEWWNTRPKKWKIGGSVQPVYFKYADTIKNDLNYKGKVYLKGEAATLVYQFHNATLTANYPIIFKNNLAYLRLGGTFIYRYADINFRSESNSFRDKNFIIFPLLNYEFSAHLFKNVSLFSRADFLPSLTQNVFLDGLFNVYFGIRSELKTDRKIDLGTRMFFGGFDENKPDDYANRTFFYGIVARYAF